MNGDLKTAFLGKAGYYEGVRVFIIAISILYYFILPGAMEESLRLAVTFLEAYDG